MEQVLNIGSQSSGAGAGKITFNPISFNIAPSFLDPTSAQMAAALEYGGLLVVSNNGAGKVMGRVPDVALDSPVLVLGSRDLDRAFRRCALDFRRAREPFDRTAQHPELRELAASRCPDVTQLDRACTAAPCRTSTTARS